MQRREFLSGALQTAGATGLLTTPAGQALGANDRVIVGLIGCGGRGRYVAGLMRKAPVERKHMNTSDATELHAANFIECVRSRNKPAAEVEIGHRSTTVAHLGNIAFKTGKKLHWNADTEEFVDDGDASKLLYREPRKPWNLISA